MIVGVITGGFDPIHSGHIAYIQAGAKLCDVLVIGINSDDWLSRKKGRSFMPVAERKAVVAALRGVDHVIEIDDSDGSARDAIRQAKAMFPASQILFLNGGDRTSANIPEMTEDVEFVFGVGGENKANSSSWILQEWKAPKTERSWGYYRILHTEGIHVKVKELVVDPGKSLSSQRHRQRSEFWMVSKGIAHVGLGETESVLQLNEQEGLHIDCGQWHRLFNDTKDPLKVVEIQYGSNCIEEDIERRDI
jgi:cytidyltransferase-like protein